MKILKKLFLFVLSIVVILALAGGYLGVVPGLSSIFGADKAKDLGVINSDESFYLANEKMGVSRIGDAGTTSKKILFEDAKPVDKGLSGQEISSLIAKGEWKYNPISEGFQLRINEDNTVEASGILNRTRLNGYLAVNNLSDVLKYTSKFNFLPEKVAFYVKGKANIVNNKVNLNLTSAQAGRIPLPTDSGSMKAVENFLEKRIPTVSGLNIDSLDFNNGKMNFKGAFPSKMSF